MTASVATIVITDTNFGDAELEAQTFGPEVILRVEQAATEDDVIGVAGDADALMVQWAPITERVLESLPRLRVVVRYGIGLDNIDLEAAERLGVTVRNVDDYCIEEVAAHATAAILANSRRLADYDRSVKRGEWRSDVAPSPLPPGEDPVGVVGYGRIGRLVAARLAAVGHPINVWDPYATIDGDVPVAIVGDVLELAERVNHLTLHAPLTSTTEGLVGAQLLRRLGPLGHLVNTARGGLVDEVALLAALNSGQLGWASLDVFAAEPPTAAGAELACHPRVTATPHIAYRSTASLPRLRRSAALAVKEVLSPSTTASS